MADPELSEAAKQEREAGREARAKSMEEFVARTKGKPTPTQEENDEAALGKVFVEHEADGSELEQVSKQIGAKPGATYQTRQSQAKPAAAPPPKAT
jgi:hypothetical protein